MTFAQRTMAGNWWLPEAPSRSVSGDLTLDDEGVRLSLRGTLLSAPAALQAMAERDAEAFPIVLGVTTNGKQVTLEDSVVVGTQMQLGPGVPTQRLLPRVAYVGVHVESVEDLVWTGVGFRVRHLAEWFAARGVVEQLLTDNDNRPTGYSLEYRYPTTMEANVDGARVELIPEFSVEGHPLRGRSLVPGVNWRVTVEKAVPLDRLAEAFVSPLQDLVTLGTAVSCPITHLRVFDANYRLQGTDHELQVEVLIDSHRAGLDVDSVLFPHEMLFRANMLGDRFADAIGAWLKAWQDLRSTCGLMFGPEYVGQTMFDNRVMNAVQAAEALHAVRFSSLEVSPDEYEQRVAAVLGSAPDAHRGWLERKLRFGNQVDLGRRLNELYDHVRGVVSRLEPDRAKFVGLLVKSRNDLAHRGSLAPNTDLARLHHAVESLTYTVKACLVRELGFDGPETARLFANSNRYRQEVEVGSIV
jgi:hypothetical protein